jgi:hypothetical protein
LWNGVVPWFQPEPAAKPRVPSQRTVAAVQGARLVPEHQLAPVLEIVSVSETKMIPGSFFVSVAPALIVRFRNRS